MSENPKHTNRLINETSPYLQQHAHNPVDWYPWGDEAFEKAKAESKPIFLSVGYSACHWCHVMEHESFENEGIAELLNRNFISIKVDREERPDVDQIYMSAVQLITKRGGWPMSVFMTAEGKPFYGGTYWPPTSRMGMPGFRDIIMKLADYWNSKREEVDTSAQQLVEAIQQMAAPAFDSADLNEETIKLASKQLLASADRKHGGFGGAPKFPHPMDIRVLLRAWKRFGEQDALDTVLLTLKKMAAGGMYDQLGGGFHRYSTDAYWLVPHFEKMLYDNALFVPAYIEGWQATGDETLTQTVRETLDYTLREMTSPEGGFYSTQDADSEGEEGKFFVWSESEVDELLDDEEARVFKACYDVSARGNWEGNNILNLPESLESRANDLQVTVEELSQTLANAKEKLFDKRSERIAPGRDDKVLVAWNGMMITAMAQAGWVLQNEDYLNAARNAARFCLDTVKDDTGRLLHSFKDGQARFSAYLDDYACLIDGLVELYQATAEENWLAEAVRLAEELIEHFADAEGGFFFTANDAEQLIARTKDGQDNAVPSGNGMAATALAKLAKLTARDDFETQARKTLESISGMIADHPRAVGQSLIALDFLLGPTYEVVINVGQAVPDSDEKAAHSRQAQPDLQKMLEALQQNFLPNKVVAWTGNDSSLVGELTAGKGSDQSRVYICQQGACQMPAENVEQLGSQLVQMT